jgi:hypothetical protein
MLRSLFFAGTLGISLALSASSSFGAAGQAVGVDPQAELQVSNQSITLTVGADVDIGQTITTGDAGQVELLFGEGTKLVVGPGSSLLIEDYLLRGEGEAGSFAVNALAGTFRFFTGSMAKSSYRIDTPTGTLGVRGTIFDLYVIRGQNAMVTLLEGGLNICRKGVTDCEKFDVDSSSPCSTAFLSIAATGFEDLDAKSLGRYFPYLMSDQRLHDPFRVPNAKACFRSLTEGETSSIESEQASP